MSFKNRFFTNKFFYNFILFHISLSLSKGDPVDVVMLDFAKVFDTVPHKRLILKLEAYGITGLAVKWVKAFLTNRRQRVVQGEFISDWKDVSLCPKEA